MTHGMRRRWHVVSFFATLSLALGIAGNAVVFSLISPTIFKPLPYPNPDRIVLLGQRAQGQPDITMFSLLSSLGVWAAPRWPSWIGITGRPLWGERAMWWDWC